MSVATRSFLSHGIRIFFWSFGVSSVSVYLCAIISEIPNAQSGPHVGTFHISSLGGFDSLLVFICISLYAKAHVQTIKRTEQSQKSSSIDQNNFTFITSKNLLSFQLPMFVVM